MEYLNLSAPHRGYIFIFMVFTLRKSARKLKILFDLCGFGAEELTLYNLAQVNIFRRDSQSRLVSHLPYGLLGSDYRGFPGCLPNLGIISALQDFLPNTENVFGRKWHLRKNVDLVFWRLRWSLAFLKVHGL